MVTLDGLTIELNTDHDGYLAEIIKQAGEKVPVEEPIALYMTTNESFMSYVESEREAAHDEALLQKVLEEKSKTAPPKFDNKLLLKELKNLVNEGLLVEGTGNS